MGSRWRSRCRSWPTSFVLTAAPIVETVRLSLGAPLDGGFPSLGRYRALLASDLFRAAFRNTLVVVLLSLDPRDRAWGSSWR